MDEHHLLFRRSSDQPLPLTSGPIRWDSPIPGKDGKTIFASGVNPRGELIRFNSQSRQFEPFLGGISADSVSFSRDGKSVAYVSYPDGILWRANGDGSSRMQLTDGTFYPRLPSWSPDGTQILFMTSPPHGGTTRAYMVSSQGGTPRLLFPGEAGPETGSELVARPDGRLPFRPEQRGSDDPKSVICILERDSNHVTTLPGSNGMFSPRWSPDGHSIVTLNPKITRAEYLRRRDAEVVDAIRKATQVFQGGREITGRFTFWGFLLIRVCFEFLSLVEMRSASPI